MSKINKDKYGIEEIKSFEDQITIVNKKLIEHSSNIHPDLTNILQDILKLINNLRKV